MGRYTRMLIQHLAELDQRNQYLLFLAKDNAQDFGVEKSNFRTVIVPLPPRQSGFFEQLILPLYLYRYDPCLVHYTGWAACLAYRGRSIMTIHDVNYRVQRRAGRVMAYYKQLFERSARMADRIVTVSLSSKRQIGQLLGVPDEKIEVIYEAAAACFTAAARGPLRGELRQRYGIRGRYILGVGTLEPNKNFRALLQAFRLIRDKVPDRLQLVIVGQKGWGYAELLSNANAGAPRGDTILTGYVPDADLADLYGGADVFVFPSFSEGFGLPALEAMSCGTPVIASNTSSMPEVVGDAGLLVDPHNTQDIAQAMVEVVQNNSLRRTMTRRGLERARTFSWDRCARETRDLYESLI